MMDKHITSLDFIGSGVKHSEGYILSTDPEHPNRMIAQVRGYGEMMALLNYDGTSVYDVQQRLGKFVEDAINEKIERDTKSV